MPNPVNARLEMLTARHRTRSGGGMPHRRLSAAYTCLLSDAHVPNEFDVLSIVVDRNTSHVWRALSAFRPRLLIIEYNASLRASDEWEVPYDADAVWDESSYFGASLESLERIGAECVEAHGRLMQ